MLTDSIYKYNYDNFYLSVSIYYLLLIIYVYVCDLLCCLLTVFYLYGSVTL